MKELPRLPVEPLSPPPGQFDTVLKRATHRRHRRAASVLTVTAVFFAGVAGGMSLDRTVVRTTVDTLAAGVGLGQTTTSTPTNSASKAPKTHQAKESKRPRKTASSAPAEVPPVVAQPSPRGTLAVRGRAVSTTGEPIAGLFVYPGTADAASYQPTRTYAVTDSDGRFTLPCTRTPVLLSPWPLNAPAGHLAATAKWAATFVGGATDPASAPDAECARKGRTDTRIQHGSAVSGTVDIPAACTDEPRSFWLWLYNDRQVTVRVTGLLDGASFQVAGLPPGQHTLGAGGQRTKVTVGGGETLSRDVIFGCDVVVPSPSPSPTTSPSPTATGSPEPSSTGPASPTPSGSTAAPMPASTG